MPDLALAAQSLTRMVNALRFVVAEKSIATLSAGYEKELTRLVNSVQAGRMTAEQMATTHRNLVKTVGPAAFAEGLKAGGVDESEIDDEDQATIDAWVAGQLPYIGDFARAAAETDVSDRITLWTRSVQTVGNLGRMSADRNMMGTWKMALGVEDHCNSCMGLHNVRHRLKWFTAQGFIPREPGSETLACHGYRCGCKIVSDSGKQLL